ncbi:MAG: DUF1573 domain-containing protein [Patescibacteria group bacterium]
MTNKNNLIIYSIGFGILIVLVSLLIINQNNGSAGLTTSNSAELTTNGSAGFLAAIESNFDFGTISMRNGKVSYKFEIKNDGTEPLTINKIYTSCMCTTVTMTDSTGKNYGIFGMPGHGGAASRTNVKLDAGKSLMAEAVFDPAAHGPSGVGLAQRTVYFETDSIKSPTLELNFTATVINK